MSLKRNRKTDITFRGENLLRVILLPVGGDSQLGSITDCAWRFLTAELYDDGVVLGFAGTGERASLSKESGLIDKLELEDDLGSPYKFYASGGFGRDEIVRLEVICIPAVPSSATQLEIRAFGGTVKLHVAEAGGR